MYKFIKEIDENNRYDCHRVEIVLPHTHADLDTLLEVFEYFLKSAGFYLKGSIEVIEDEETTEDD